MARMRHGHVAVHLQHRDARPSPLEHVIAHLPNLAKRDASNTCTKDDKSAQCAKPADSNNITLPIVLGIVYVPCSHSK